MMRERQTFRLMLIGNSGVGKSALLHRFANHTFIERRSATIGMDVATAFVYIDGKPVELRIWDTAGQERFRSIGANFYRSADGVVIVYSVTDEKSFSSVMNWMHEVDRHAGDNVAKILVGNKSDLLRDRIIDFSLGKKYASEFSIPFVETSAKDGHSVDEAFLTLAMEAKKRYSPPQEEKQIERSINLLDIKTETELYIKKGGCCASKLWTQDKKSHIRV